MAKTEIVHLQIGIAGVLRDRASGKDVVCAGIALVFYANSRFTLSLYNSASSFLVRSVV